MEAGSQAMTFATSIMIAAVWLSQSGGRVLGRLRSRQSNARSQHAFVDERAVADGSPHAGLRACCGGCQRPRTAEGKDGGCGRHGLEKVRKRYLAAAMAFNLGRIMRSLVGAGKPRYLAVSAERLRLNYFIMQLCCDLSQRPLRPTTTFIRAHRAPKSSSA